MPRAVPEWRGKTDNSPVPKRVKLRILKRQGDCCTGCGKQFGARLKPIFDHRPALINDGENRESKIEAICDPCHGPRTKDDVAEKKVTNRMKEKILGIRIKSGRKIPKRHDPWGKEYLARRAGQSRGFEKRRGM